MCLRRAHCSSWQIVDRIASRRTRLQVDVSRVLPSGADAEDQEVVVRVVNRGEHPVHVARSFVWQEATGRKWDIASPGAQPFELAPRNGHNMRAFLRDLSELGFGQPVTAAVITQDGKFFNSKPTVIVPLEPRASLPPRRLG